MNGWGWFGMVMMVIVIVAIVGLVIWAIARQPGAQQQPSAREQLDERLARGEIDTNECRERLEALSGHRVGK